jgi:hypothetical protein
VGAWLSRHYIFPIRFGITVDDILARIASEWGGASDDTDVHIYDAAEGAYRSVRGLRAQVRFSGEFGYSDLSTLDDAMARVMRDVADWTNGVCVFEENCEDDGEGIVSTLFGPRRQVMEAKLAAGRAHVAELNKSMGELRADLDATPPDENCVWEPVFLGTERHL